VGEVRVAQAESRHNYDAESRATLPAPARSVALRSSAEF
jgi:hypothetical protein